MFYIHVYTYIIIYVCVYCYIHACMYICILIMILLDIIPQVAMRALGFEPKKEEIKRMIADIDKDGSGC